MFFSDFYQSIECALQRHYKRDASTTQTESSSFFLRELTKLAHEEADESLKMTRATILFEGFYRYLVDFNLKQEILTVRNHRWSCNFSTPTVPFLLSYKMQIDSTKIIFETGVFEVEGRRPWVVNKESFVLDKDNDVLADPQSMTSIAVPPKKELMGVFTKTYNPLGGFTTSPCDLISQRFIEHAAISAASGGKVLEIGAAFGAATLEALSKGATVFCNDISPENLAVVQTRYLEMKSQIADSLPEEHNKLVLVPGELPDELHGLPENFFDAILICRVLHFLTGNKIDESLALMAKLLTKNGKIYIVCETPFLKNWQRFIPEFKSRVEKNTEWPGEISNPADYESSGRAIVLPRFVHWITKEVLQRSLLRAGFAVEHVEYINRAGQFPDDLILPEFKKESVGAIGISKD